MGGRRAEKKTSRGVWEGKTGPVAIAAGGKVIWGGGQRVPSKAPVTRNPGQVGG